MKQIPDLSAGVALMAMTAVLSAGCNATAEPIADRDTAENARSARPAVAETTQPLHDWPPQVGQPYPDHEFHDAEGKPVRLSQFRGRVLLIEPIGMNCPACNAFAGASLPGKSGFMGTRPQPGLKSLEQNLPLYAGGVTADHPDLVIVHLLLYSMRMQAPTVEDARNWADHFGIDRANHVVLFADPRFINKASYAMIPGFQLVDREFVLRVDSTGHHPRDDLYRTLLPRLGEMLTQ